MIGVLSSGNVSIVFEVSPDKMRTWKEAHRNGAARWVQHEVYGGKPIQEFIGPGLSSIELKGIRLDRQFGVNPSAELTKMRELRDVGAVLQFTLGDQRSAGFVGDFIIKDIDETWSRIDNHGILMAAIVDLQLEEYAENKVQSQFALREFGSRTKTSI